MRRSDGTRLFQVSIAVTARSEVPARLTCFRQPGQSLRPRWREQVGVRESGFQATPGLCVGAALQTELCHGVESFGVMRLVLQRELQVEKCLALMLQLQGGTGRGRRHAGQRLALGVFPQE